MIAEIKPSDEGLPEGLTAVFLDGYRFAIQMDSMEENMTGATLLIKRMPPELKLWLAGEAERNHRSMNKEAIQLLEEARTLRDKAFKPARDIQALASILQTMRAFPVLNALERIGRLCWNRSGDGSRPLKSQCMQKCG